MEKNRTCLQAVTDRIKLAQARVHKIKGSKKATKVIHTPHTFTNTLFSGLELHYYLEHSQEVSTLSAKDSCACCLFEKCAHVFRFFPALNTLLQRNWKTTRPSLWGLLTQHLKNGHATKFRASSVLWMTRPCR